MRNTGGRFLSSISKMNRPTSVYVAACAGSARTFQHQNELPPLPVPDLNESCDLYLKSIQPLADQTQFENTKNVVDQFRQNEGPILQKRLLEHAKETQKHNKSWLEDFWLDAAYLAFRAPLPTNSNYYILFDKAPRNLKQTKIAAKIIRGALEFKKQLENEEVTPEYLRRTTPQCMDQYKKIFSTSRVAKSGTDILLQFEGSKHVVVIANKQFFNLQVLDQEGNAYSAAALEKRLEEILSFSAQHSHEQVPPIGAITAIERDESANMRTMLEKDNKERLHSIDTALFAISLDGDEPNSMDQAGEWINGGNENTAPNRWFEKLCNFVVFKNGWSGLTGEHCPLDAPIVGTMTNYFLQHMSKEEVNGDGSENVPAFENYQWEINPSVADELKNAQKKAAEVLLNCELVYQRYSLYGADWIKKVAKTSPDAFVQMSIQLAYYYTHNDSTATYETGTARCFFHGRTDTVRTLSSDSREWTVAMADPQVSVNDKLSHFRKALDSHSSYMKRAIDGKVIDRHFLGLRLVKKPTEDAPAMFVDPLWRQSTRFRLSTSNMTSNYYVAGFGPTEEDGYGVCYGTRSDSLEYSITSFRSCAHTSAKNFSLNLQKALDHMRSLFNEQAKL
uniref:Choline/carnitine acyltransferase domain-containing protein n=1 Tax=Vannella robusta TaxID=1487602 RepID=A0A7S4MLA7_9EUKA